MNDDLREIQHRAIYSDLYRRSAENKRDIDTLKAMQILDFIGSVTHSGLSRKTSADTKVGHVYNILDSIEEGELSDIKMGDNVVCVGFDGSKPLWDLFASPVDLSGYVQTTTLQSALDALPDTYYNKNQVYSKSETYAKSETYSKSETYTKSEVNSELSNQFRNRFNYTNPTIYSGETLSFDRIGGSVSAKQAANKVSVFSIRGSNKANRTTTATVRFPDGWGSSVTCVYSDTFPHPNHMGQDGDEGGGIPRLCVMRIDVNGSNYRITFRKANISSNGSTAWGDCEYGELALKGVSTYSCDSGY